MKIVLDTNVLIASLLTPTGMSHDVLARAFKKHIVILSDYILNEFQSILVRKFQWPVEAIEEAQKLFRVRAMIVNPTEKAEIVFDDPKDIPILGLMHFTKAHFLITGDKKLIELRKFDGTFILSPREALERL